MTSNSLCPPYTVNFTNLSTGGIFYTWYFGDGNTSNLRNPIHIYYVGGTYTLKLVVNGANGTKDSIVKANFITVPPAPKVNVKLLSSGALIVPVTVSFQAQIDDDNGIGGTQWDFGDGQIIATINPSIVHTYSTPGIFNARLTVVGENGCQTISSPVVIAVQPLSVKTTTTGGTGSAGYSGDGGPATQGSLNNPSGVVADCDGNIYVADAANNVIRKITKPAGTISTTAGTGTAGNKGDNGPAKTAQLNNPTAVAVTCDGDIYIADTKNNVIRKVDNAGNITTVAGNGAAVYSGDGGSAVLAGLNKPSSIVTGQSGEYYIADAANNCIRMVSANGIITTFAGTGQAGYSGDNALATAARLNLPQGIALDGEGNIYIADTKNNVIRKLGIDGIITTIAGTGKAGYKGDNGPAIEALLNQPTGVAVDAAGNIYVSDTYNNKIRKIFTNGYIYNFTTTVTASGLLPQAADTTFKLPLGIYLTGNKLLVADAGNNVIKTLAADTSAVLAINTLDFTVSLTNSTVKCAWQTSGEINVSRFVIERSADGIHFVKLDSLKAKGAGSTFASYQFIDANLPTLNSTQAYYRLKTINTDGSFIYSKTQGIKLPVKNAFTIWPNPVKGNVFTVQASNDVKLPAVYNLYDMSGKLIASGKITSRQQTITVSSQLASGSYFVKIGDAHATLLIKY